jgi:hypothetical protein
MVPFDRETSPNAMRRSFLRRRPFASPRAAGEAAVADPARAALRLLSGVLLAAPLVVLPGHVDFARLPQQAFVVVSALALSLVWMVRGGTVTGRATRLDLPLLAFLAWSAVSLLASAEPAAGLERLGHWTAAALVFAVVSRAARADDVPRLASPLLLGGAAAAVVGLGQALLGLTLVPQAAPPAATLANRGVAAGHLAVVAPLALLAWPGRGARIAAAAAAGTITAFLPFTASREAAAAVAVQALLLVALGERPRGRRGLGRITLAGGVAGLALAAAVGLSLVDAAKARSAEIRLSLAGSALSMSTDHPLLGVGLGRFGSVYPSHGPVVTSAEGAPLRVDSPHNEGLQVLAETGLPGLLAGLWAAARSVRALRRLRRSANPAVRRAALALALSLAGFAVDGAFGFPLRSAVPPLVLAVLLGLVAALDVRESGQSSPRVAPAGRLVRFAAATGLSAALVGALSWSFRSLEDDRSLYRRAFLPVAHAQSGAPRPGPPGAGAGAACRPGVTLEARADGRIDLVADAAPLADVLACLAETLGLRLEYQGRPPRQSVSASLRDQTPAVAVASLLEGLGVDYLLGLDPSRAKVDHLIVLDSSGGAVSSPGAAPPPGAPAERIAEPPPAGEAPGLGTELPGGEGTEPVPSPFEPADLTPMTLQLGRPPGRADPGPGSPGNRKALGS